MGFWKRVLIDALHDNPISNIAFKRRKLKEDINDISDPLLTKALTVYLTTDPEPTEKIEEIILDKRTIFAYKPFRKIFDEDDIYYHLLLPQDDEMDYNEFMKEKGIDGDRVITLQTY